MAESSNQSGAAWVFDEWSSHLASALSSMTDSAIACSAEREPPAVAPSGLNWHRLALSAAPDATLAAGAEPESWKRLGAFALQAAGLPEASEEDIRGTTTELLNQAGSGLAQALARRIGRDVSFQAAELSSESPATPGFAVCLLPLGDGPPARIVLAVSPALAALAALQEASPPPRQLPPAPPPESEAAPRSKTLDLLMEVEMPVSVSFGRAYIPLRDVLKLNSGSIVELNRTVNEPVEIIVNNCVIARGEVVVVEGNYGVRIQQVISREERLRTLN